MTVGERIKAARKKAGLTQLQVAERMGDVTFQSVSQWERGLRCPKYETLARLSAAIGCPLSELAHDLSGVIRDKAQMCVIVEQKRLIWEGKVFEKILSHDFSGARCELAFLQGIEYLAEALDLMGSNISGRFALSELIDDAEAAYILSQEGE